jgi:hypothetical protein
MPLTYFGESRSTLNGTRYRTTGSKGEDVVVEASHEALKDYGETKVQQKASDKYDAGEVHENKVTVRTSDFA